MVQCKQGSSRGHLYAGYEQEARYFEAGVRQAKQQELQGKLAAMVRDLFQHQLANLHRKLMQAFKGDLGGSIMDKTQPFAQAAERQAAKVTCLLLAALESNLFAC